MGLIMPLQARYSLYGLGSAPTGSIMPLWARYRPLRARKCLYGLGNTSITLLGFNNGFDDPLGVHIGNPLWVAHEVLSLMARRVRLWIKPLGLAPEGMVRYCMHLINSRLRVAIPA